MSRKCIKIQEIINDPAIVVNPEEDLKIQNHIPFLVVKALNVCRGQINIAAEKLGVSVRSVHRYKKDHLIAYDKKLFRFVSLQDYKELPLDIEKRFEATPQIISTAKTRLTVINNNN